MMPAIRATGSALGAFVDKIDLREPLSTLQRDALASALAEHQALFFREQAISPQQHRDFGKAFGPLEEHPSFLRREDVPEVAYLDNGRDNPSTIDEWHTDMSFKPRPPKAGILLARIVPPKGGDTLFSSSAAAYEDLPASERKALEGLTAVHSYEWGYRDSLAEPGGRARLQSAIDTNPDVVHPLVREHPVTGRRILFLNRTFTRHINGLSQGESDSLIEQLCDHMINDRYVYRFQWQPGSIAFWDNFAVMHKPVNDYWPERRRVERVTLA
ncbi:MAG: TauD/TfdA family dioxygenase [Pseudomonadota bacterium]